MIDEKKLIEDLKQYAHLSAGDSVDTIKVIIKIVGEQPKIGEWIPCSERLPEMHREGMEAEGEYYMISNPVLVTDGNKMHVAEYEEDDGYRYGWHSFDGEDYDNIIAWMPLPEPYRTEKENNPEWKDRMMQTFLGGRR